MRCWNDYLYSEDELQHFGILGMHWGKKNGPPYPLGYSDHTAEQKRKNKKSVIDGKQNTTSNSNKSKQTTSSNSNQSRPDDLEIDKDKRFQQCLKDKGISDNTKKLLIGAAVTVGIVGAGYLAYKYNAVSKISKAEMSDALLKTAFDSLDAREKSQINRLMKSSLSEVDTILKKETAIHRQVGYKDFDLKKTAGTGLYASYKKSDTAIYRRFLKDWSHTGKRYDVTMEALHDIKMPSDKKAIEIFDKVWKENPEYKKELLNTLKKYNPTVTDREILQAISADPFGSGMFALVKQGKDAQMIYAEVRKQGYNAIRDYFDAPITYGIGQQRISDSPMILVDALKDVKVTDISKVSLFTKAKDYHIINEGIKAGNKAHSTIALAVRRYWYIYAKKTSSIMNKEVNLLCGIWKIIWIF